MKKSSRSHLFAVLALIAILSMSIVPSILAQDDATLTATRVEMGSLDPFDALWDAVPNLEVPLALPIEGSELPVVAGYTYPEVNLVSLKAAYTDSEIFVLAVWRDDSENSNRAEWTFDGTAWSKNKLNEDRLSFLFDVTGSAQFNALGPDAAAQTASEGVPAHMGFPADSTDAVDMWHWKASRSAPAGYADDGWIGAYVAEAETGRGNDARESGGYADNVNEAGDAPAFVYPEGALPGSPLLGDIAVPFDPAVEFPAGYTVPGYVITRPVGSRGDISASSFYVSGNNGQGWWYVVLSRPLNTGNAEDTIFTLNSSNTFGVAAFNNSADELHTVSGKLTLVIGE